MVLSSMSALAKEKVVPVGVPARLEAINGKVAKVMLQSQVGNDITFRSVNSTRDMKVDKSKVKSLTFFPKYDADAVEKSFNEADYTSVLSTLNPVMEPYWEYMTVSNNMRSAFYMLLVSSRETGDFATVKKAADIMMKADSPDTVLKGKVNAALVALSEGDIQTAEALRKDIGSEPASLFLQACIQRAQDDPRAASRTIAKVISQHGNDMLWMPYSEMLSAQLYLDAGMTNSADVTARQVQNFYAGTQITKNADKLRSGLESTTVETE